MSTGAPPVTSIVRSMEQRHRLTLAKYPRSANWALAHMMGPNPLWLVEALLSAMHPKPDMRVLDLGCGKAISSIFLARELDVQVWVADLWIALADNLTRLVARVPAR